MGDFLEESGRARLSVIRGMSGDDLSGVKEYSPVECEDVVGKWNVFEVGFPWKSL